MNILAADIGGTKSWLCLAKVDEKGKQDVLFEQLYQSQDFTNATHLLEHFLQEASTVSLKVSLKISLKIHRMCLALPGVVTDRKAGLTNLDWQLDADHLALKFSIDQVTFINDFEAAALGVSTLTQKDLIILNKAQAEEKAVRVVTGAGTGLGLAWLNYAHGGYRANATEGGHIDFAPVTTQQVDLLKFLMKDYEHVSYERILSGEGLQHIYRFLNSGTRGNISPSEITASAEQGYKLAQESLDLFVEIYAAYIGNLAVLFKPAGGIYIAGGIASKILPWMQSAEFLSAYFYKGRMRKVAESTPVYLINNNRLGLQGALSVVI